MSEEFEKWYLNLIQDEDFIHIDNESAHLGYEEATEAMQAKLDEKAKEIEALQLKLDKVLKVVHEQALDEGLWFNAEYVTEAYLQKELRRLTSAIEEK